MSGGRPEMPAGEWAAGGGPRSSTGFWLRIAAQAWQRELTRRLRPLDLTAPQFMVLSSAGWLRATRGLSPTQQEVAEMAGTDRMMTSKLVTSLEAAGLLVREKDDRERRVRRLRQTDEGRRVTQAGLEQVAALERELFASVPDGFVDQLGRIAASGDSAEA